MLCDHNPPRRDSDCTKSATLRFRSATGLSFQSLKSADKSLYFKDLGPQKLPSHLNALQQSRQITYTKPSLDCSFNDLHSLPLRLFVILSLAKSRNTSRECCRKAARTEKNHFAICPSRSQILEVLLPPPPRHQACQ